MTYITQEQFKKCTKQFVPETQRQMSIFRHMTKEQQDKFLHEIEMNTLYSIMYLKQIQQLDNNPNSVIQRY